MQRTNQAPPTMTRAELSRVVELEAKVAARLQDQPDGTYHVDTTDHPDVPDRVWRELVRRCELVGWAAEWDGTSVSIRLRH